MPYTSRMVVSGCPMPTSSQKEQPFPGIALSLNGMQNGQHCRVVLPQPIKALRETIVYEPCQEEWGGEKLLVGPMERPIC